nr:hypothetical protein CFP56_78755 [Quercus suber]
MTRGIARRATVNCCSTLGSWKQHLRHDSFRYSHRQIRLNRTPIPRVASLGSYKADFNVALGTCKLMNRIHNRSLPREHPVHCFYCAQLNSCPHGPRRSMGIQTAECDCICHKQAETQRLSCYSTGKSIGDRVGHQCAIQSQYSRDRSSTVMMLEDISCSRSGNVYHRGSHVCGPRTYPTEIGFRFRVQKTYTLRQQAPASMVASQLIDSTCDEVSYAVRKRRPFLRILNRNTGLASPRSNRTVLLTFYWWRPVPRDIHQLEICAVCITVETDGFQ